MLLIKFTLPVAPRGGMDNYFGVKVPDPYRAMLAPFAFALHFPGLDVKEWLCARRAQTP
jgi:hypothetical protein